MSRESRAFATLIAALFVYVTATAATLGQLPGVDAHARAEQDVATAGVPTIGAAGVERTTAELMTQIQAQDTATNRSRLPRRQRPDRRSLPEDFEAEAVANTPARQPRESDPAPQPSAPQVLSTSFTGATAVETGAFPPDTMGAVGPTQFVVFLNGRLRTFNKTTGVADGVIDTDTDVFFASVMTPPPSGGINFAINPQVRYDRLTSRWILTMIDAPTNLPSFTNLPNRLLIAVSDAASAGVITPSTAWTFYFVQQDTVGGIPSTGEFLDYPSLGVDSSALYVGGDMFVASTGAFVNTSAFVIRKSSILSGGPIVTTAFRNLIAGGDGPASPRGVDNYDPAASEGYIIGASSAVFDRLIIRRISTPGATPAISANILLTVAATSFPLTVDHLGNTGGTNGRLAALDDRLLAAHIRKGRLWTAHTIAVLSTGVAAITGTQRRNAVRWYELNGVRSSDNGGVPIVVQSGTIFDAAATVAAARQFWMPAVMVSGQGHAALGFSTAGTPFRIDAATNGRLAGDALGTLGAVLNYTASSFAYNPPADSGGTSGRRWGAYSFTSLDPGDDMTMWTIQEFCNATNSYGVRVVKLLAPPPASPASASPSAVVQGLPSTLVTITGSSSAGSGFFDPGPGFANRLTATVSGGVIVNAATFVDATHVTLDVSTIGVASGARTVTITNPDGQPAAGAVFTVAPSGFTDDPLVAGLSVIRAVHVTQLRSRIDAVRATHLLGPYPYTDTITAVTTTILARHILQMRTALDQAYDAAQRPKPTYSTTPAVGVPVVVADILTLRSAVLALE